MVISKGAIGMWLPLCAFSLLGLVLVEFRRRRRIFPIDWWRRLAYGFSMTLLATVILGVTGCGGYNRMSANGTPRGTTTIVVTATSGASLSHSTNVSLTVR